MKNFFVLEEEGYPNYTIFREGQIMNNNTGRFIKAQLRHKKPYVMLRSLKRNIKPRMTARRLDTLMYKYFLPDFRPKLHKPYFEDGDPMNCHISNLRYTMWKYEKHDPEWRTVGIFDVEQSYVVNEQGVLYKKSRVLKRIDGAYVYRKGFYPKLYEKRNGSKYYTLRRNDGTNINLTRERIIKYVWRNR